LKLFRARNVEKCQRTTLLRALDNGSEKVVGGGEKCIISEREEIEREKERREVENLPLSSSTTTGLGAVSLTGSACSVVGEVGCEGDCFERNLRVSQCKMIERKF